MAVNAYAIGYNGIVLTRGALYTLNEEELKGIIAHKTGHLFYGDAILPLVVNFGFAPVFPFMMFARLFESSFKRQTGSKFSGGIIALFSFPFRLLSMAISRRDEYYADMFAFNLGYGEGLKEALYKISKITVSEQRPLSLMERLEMSHPDIFLRIIKLEKSL